MGNKNVVNDIFEQESGGFVSASAGQMGRWSPVTDQEISAVGGSPATSDEIRGYGSGQVIDVFAPANMPQGAIEIVDVGSPRGVLVVVKRTASDDIGQQKFMMPRGSIGTLRSMVG